MDLKKIQDLMMQGGSAKQSPAMDEFDRLVADHQAKVDAGTYEQPLPELSVGRVKGAVVEEIKMGIRDRLTGIGAVTGGVERRGRDARKTRHQELGELQRKLGQDKYINRDEQMTQYTEFSSEVLAVAASEALKADPNFQVSSGWVEDQIRSLTQVGMQISVTAVGGAGVGIMDMGNMILGSTYTRLKAQGVDDDRALTASFLNALVQAPMEQIGISKAARLFQPKQKGIKFLKYLTEMAGTEFVTEYLQNVGPEKFFDIWATNPDDSTLEQMAKWGEMMKDTDVHLQAMKEGGHAALSAVLLGGPRAYRRAQQPDQAPPPDTTEEEVVEEEVEEEKKPYERTQANIDLFGEEEVTPEEVVPEEVVPEPPKPEPPKKEEPKKPTKIERDKERLRNLLKEEEPNVEEDVTPEEQVQEEPVPPEEAPKEELPEPTKPEEPAQLPEQVTDVVEEEVLPEETEPREVLPKKETKKQLTLEDLIAQQIDEDPAGLNEFREEDDQSQNDEKTLDDLMSNATPNALDELTSQFGSQEDVTAPDKTPTLVNPGIQDPNDLLEVMAEEQHTDLDTLKEQFGYLVPEQESTDKPGNLGISYGEMTQPVFVPADGSTPIRGVKHDAITGKGEGGHNKAQREGIRNSVAALRKRTKGIPGYVGYFNKKGEVFSLKEIEQAKIGTKKQMEEPEGAGGKWRGDKGPVVVAQRNAAKLEKAADNRFEKKVALMRDGMTPEQEAAVDNLKKYVRNAARTQAYEQNRPQDFDDLYNGGMEEAITFVMTPGNEDKYFGARDVMRKLGKGTNITSLVANRATQERKKGVKVSSGADITEAKGKAEAVDEVRTEWDNIAADAEGFGITLNPDNPEAALEEIEDMSNGMLDLAAKSGANQAGVSKQLTALSMLKLQIEGQLLPQGDKVLSDFEEGTPEYDLALKEFEDAREIDQLPSEKPEMRGTPSGGPTAKQLQPTKGKATGKLQGTKRAPTAQDSLPMPQAGAFHPKQAASTKGAMDPSKEKMHGPFKTRAAAEKFIDKQYPHAHERNNQKVEIIPSKFNKKGVPTEHRVKYEEEYTGRVQTNEGPARVEPELHSIGTRVYGSKMTKLSDTDLALERERRADFNAKRDAKEARQKAKANKNKKRDKKRYEKQDATKKEKRTKREEQGREKSKRVSLWEEESAQERTAKATDADVEAVLAQNAVNKPAKKKQLTKEDRALIAARTKARGGKTPVEAKATDYEPFKGKKTSKTKKDANTKKLQPDELDLHKVTQADMDAIAELGSKEDVEIIKGVMGVGDAMAEPLAKYEDTNDDAAIARETAEATARGKELGDPVEAPEIGAVHGLVLQELQNYPNIDPKTKEPKVNSKGEEVPWTTSQAQEAVNDILADRETEMTTNLTGGTKKAVAVAYGKTPNQSQANRINQMKDEGSVTGELLSTGKKNLYDNDRGETTIFTDLAKVIIDAGNSLANTFDVQAPWRRRGADESGRAFKNFFSAKNVHAEEGMQEAENVKATLKESIPEPTDRDWADVVLLYEDKAYRREMKATEPKRFALLQPASDEFGKFWTQAEDMLKHRGIDSNPIDRMLADYERKALEADTFSKQQDYITRIEDLMNTNYVHVSVASMFRDSMRSKAKSKNRQTAKRATAFLDLASQKKRVAVSISKLLKDHSEVLEYSDVNPVDIMMRYQTRFGKDMALLDVRDALRSDELIQSIGKKKPKGWIRLGKTYGVLADHYADPDAVKMIDNLYKSTEGGNAVTRALSYIKMAAFYNPIFLPAYDMYQAAMSGVAIRHLPTFAKNLLAARKDVLNRSLVYKEAGMAGTFSKPFDYPFADYMRGVQRIIKSGKNEGFFQTMGRDIKEELVGDGSKMQTVKKIAMLRPIYRASWELAWTMDEMVRTATYRTLKEKGMSASKAGQMAAKFHGDYASVPPRTRQIMNTFLFTPTFKLAMGKLYYSMLKGSVQGAFKIARGKKASQNEQAMMWATASTAAVTFAFDAFMKSFDYEPEGDDDDWNWINYGRRYVTKIKDERGRPRELVFTWSNPGNLMQRYAQRFAAAGKNVDKTGYLGAGLDMIKWDLHPAFTTAMNMFNNRGDEGEEIWNQNDDPIDQAYKQSIYATTRMIRAWDAAGKMFSDSDAPEARNLAHEYIEKDFGPFAQLVTNPLVSIMSAYTRGTPDLRTKYKINELKREFKSSQKRHYKKRGKINNTWLKNYKKKVEKEHEQYKDRRKRGDRRF